MKKNINFVLLYKCIYKYIILYIRILNVCCYFFFFLLVCCCFVYFDFCKVYLCFFFRVNLFRGIFFFDFCFNFKIILYVVFVNYVINDIKEL